MVMRGPYLCWLSNCCFQMFNYTTVKPGNNLFLKNDIFRGEPWSNNR